MQVVECGEEDSDDDGEADFQNLPDGDSKIDVPKLNLRGGYQQKTCIDSCGGGGVGNTWWR